MERGSGNKARIEGDALCRRLSQQPIGRRLANLGAGFREPGASPVYRLHPELRHLTVACSFMRGSGRAPARPGRGENGRPGGRPLWSRASVNAHGRDGAGASQKAAPKDCNAIQTAGRQASRDLICERRSSSRAFVRACSVNASVASSACLRRLAHQSGQRSVVPSRSSTWASGKAAAMVRTALAGSGTGSRSSPDER